MASLDLYIVTFNCGKAFIDVHALAAHLFKPFHEHAAQELPDLIVLNLQEVAPLAYSFIGGSYMKPWMERITQSVKQAAPQQRYRTVATHNAGQTAIIVLVKEELSNGIRWVEQADVGVGLWNMANKGAAAVRFGFSADSSDDAVALTFVAAHLAAGEKSFEKRNSDWQSIIGNLSFVSAEQGGLGKRPIEHVINEDHADAEPLLSGQHQANATSSGVYDVPSILFFSGDLNYRTSDTGPGKLEHRAFPQPCFNSSEKKHFSHLLSHDQLRREQDAGKTLQNLSESPINFPPTYKYSLDHYKLAPPQAHGAEVEPRTWHWAPHRYPSWCDRILYSSFLTASSNTLKIYKYTALPIQPTTDHRPVVLAARIMPATAIAEARKHASLYSKQIPFNPKARQMRTFTRTLEFVVGVLVYLTYTQEGLAIFLTSIVGLLGGGYILRSLFSS